MKSSFFLVFSTFALLSACQQQIRYTQQSSKINTYKKVIDAYEKQDWKGFETYYTDSAKILNNVITDNAQSVSQLIQTNNEDTKLFISWTYNHEIVEYELAVTDNGET